MSTQDSIQESHLEVAVDVDEKDSQSLQLSSTERDDAVNPKEPEGNGVSLQADIKRAKEYLSPVKALKMPQVPVFRINSNSVKLLPRQLSRKKASDGLRLNFIVAGSYGLGKSTFINMLFHNTSPSSAERTRKPDYDAPTTKLDIMSYLLEEDGIKADFTAIDVHKYGGNVDNSNCWVPVCNYIDKQHMLYMFQEEQPDRTQIVDNRVNVCLYFIEPIGKELRPLDIESMREISLRVNLIPVIAKADTMTRSELREFKGLVHKQLNDENIRVLHNCSPFAIVCSNEKATINGRECFARTYTYGTANCEDPDHSDYLALKQVLMSDCTLELIESTHNVFYNYQRHVMMIYRRRRANNNQPFDPSIFMRPLNLLKEVQKIQFQELTKEHLDKDPLFLQQVAQIRARYNRFGEHQCNRFSQQELKIRKIKVDNEKEMKQIRFDINELHERIDAISNKRR